MFDDLLEYLSTCDSISEETKEGLFKHLPNNIKLEFSSSTLSMVVVYYRELVVSVSYEVTLVGLKIIFTRLNSSSCIELIDMYYELVDSGKADIDDAIFPVLRVSNGMFHINRSFFNIEKQQKRFIELVIRNAENILKYANNNSTEEVRLHRSKNYVAIYGGIYYFRINNDFINLSTGEIAKDDELLAIESKKELLDIEI